MEKSESERASRRERERRLSEASLTGSVNTLNTIIAEDSQILYKVSATWFNETPLRLAALRGHLDFTKALLNKCPDLATKLDSQRRSPLHLASLKGHVETVQELLHVNPDMCYVRDQDGRTPLHLAVISGRINVIKKLIQARRNSILGTLDNGQSVLHLAVRYNQLEALKVLVEEAISIWNDDDHHEFLSSDDDNGNTILHLAATLKREEMVRYLISRKGAEAMKNTMNINCLTALDVLEDCPRDLKALEIQNILREAEVQRGKVIIHPPPSENIDVNRYSTKLGKIGLKVDKWMKYYLCSRGQGWYEKMEGALMTVATVFATMTFQAAINPPGGVWQENSGEDKGFACGSAEDKDQCEAGTSILAYNYPSQYSVFSACNTISLVASLSIILIIISGFPLKNKYCMGCLITMMCITVTFMGITYMVSLWLVTPDYVLWKHEKINYTNIHITVIWWIILAFVVGCFWSARFLYALVAKFPEYIPRLMRKYQSCRMRSSPPTNGSNQPPLTCA